MDDIAQAYIAVLHQLYDAGCRNVQFDDCTWGMLADKNGQEMHAATKEGLLAVQNAYKDINNQVINGAPEGMNITTHVCRGNYHSTYASSGPYDSVADVLFGEENVSAIIWNLMMNAPVALRLLQKSEADRKWFSD